MFKAFYPTYYYNNVYELDRAFWKENGIGAILFDIDNTLEPYATEIPSKKCEKLFEMLREEGVKFAIISNNHKERVEKFATPLGADYYFESLKPKTENIFAAIDKMGVSKDEVVLIGDQLFTDIWGGSRAGIRTIFVNKLSDDESFFIRLKRLIEIPFVKKIKKAGYGKL